jgi:hypothetical protein
MKSVAECLQEAGSELKMALRKLESGQQLPPDDTDASPASPANNTDSDYDPDDLAAAFFAQQAQKQQAESKLPIDTWAKTIYATSATTQSEGRAWKSSSGLVGNHQAEADTLMSDPALMDASQAKAHELWNIFESSYVNGEED